MFRWHDVTKYTYRGREHLTAIGSLDDYLVLGRFTDKDIWEMVRQAIETARWTYYLYEPRDLDSHEPEKFVAWVRHQLNSK